jgi:hypothetical protein
MVGFVNDSKGGGDRGSVKMKTRSSSIKLLLARRLYNKSTEPHTCRTKGKFASTDALQCVYTVSFSPGVVMMIRYPQLPVFRSVRSFLVSVYSFFASGPGRMPSASSLLRASSRAQV